MVEIRAQWTTTSLALIAGLRRPDSAEAWERFAREYGPAIQKFCRNRGLQQADAEDVVQALFLGVERGIGAFEYSSDKGRFRSWLSTIALRVIWKGRQRVLAQPLEYLDPVLLANLVGQQQGLLEELNTSVIDLAVLEIRAEFDDEVWDAFSSVWFSEQRPQNVADRLGRPRSWVYKAKFKVLQRLKAVVRRISDDVANF